MTQYLLADLHFDDASVLEYANRSFGSVGEMNDALVAAWNAVVDDRDTVVFLGDFTAPSEPTTVRRWLRRLQGDVIFIAGDHDAGARRSTAVTAHRRYAFTADGYQFQCVHDPDDAHPGFDGWVIHGHHHNLRVDTYPFLDPTHRRINVSVELINNSPLPVGELLTYLNAGRRLTHRPA